MRRVSAGPGRPERDPGARSPGGSRHRHRHPGPPCPGCPPVPGVLRLVTRRPVIAGGLAVFAPAVAAAGAQRDAKICGGLAKLAVQVLPFADPQVVQVLAAAHPAERRGGQRALLRAQVVPQVQESQEVRSGLGEARVHRIRRLTGVGRAFPRVLDRQGRRDDQHLADAAVTPRLDDHPPDARVDRQLGQLAADVAQQPAAPAAAARRRVAAAGRRGEGAELLQQPDAVRDVALLRRVDEREVGHLAQVERGHPQDDGGQVGAQDLRIGELRPGGEVLLAVEADADSVGRTPAPALPLAG